MAEEKDFKAIQMKNAAGQNLYPITDAGLVNVSKTVGETTTIVKLDAELKDLQQQISNAVAGGITDVQVNGTSVVENNVASINAVTSVKVGKTDGDVFAVNAAGLVDITTGVDARIATAIAGRYHMSVEVLPALPESATEDDLGRIVLIADPKVAAGTYIEYIAVQTGDNSYAWEQIGTTAVDLTDYAKAADVYTKTAVDEIVEEINDAIDLKANAADVYDKTAAEGMVDNKITALKLGETYAPISLVQTVTDNKTATDAAIELKANAADVYTKGDVDGLIDGVEAEVAKKANSTDVYTKGEIDSTVEGINGEIAKKADATVTVDGKNLNVLYYEEV